MTSTVPGKLDECAGPGERSGDNEDVHADSRRDKDRDVSGDD